MKFLWPELLWLEASLPLLALAYVWLLSRKRKAALRFANLALVREALAGSAGWPRHLPPLLFLAALGMMVFAVARPTAVLSLPVQHETVVLAIDVSGSMRAADVQPTRLAAAQAAAKAFVTQLPRSVRVGIVSFAASASVVQYPTLNREDIAKAIDRFQVQRGTALGSAIIVSLATLFPDAGFDVSALINGADTMRRFGRPPKADPKKEEPVPPGSYNGGAIILVTDGQRTTGPEVAEAIKMAAARGVRIFTVGIGTTKGETIGFEGMSMRVKLDEETLKQVANGTRGAYFQAGNERELRKVYDTLNARLTLEKKETEISAVFVAAAALLATLAAGLSLLWFNRIL